MAGRPKRLSKYESHEKECECDGYITIFFSLIFLILLSLILTTLEGARISAVQSCVNQSLSSAMDSVFADYDGPLFEEYQIFGRCRDDTKYSLLEENYEQQLLEEMSYVFSPLQDGKASEDSYYQMLQADITGVKVSNLTYLTDDDGEWFYRQAADAMKYQAGKMGGQKLLESMHLIESETKSAQVFQMQEKATKKLAAIDQVVIQLMESLDGVHLKNGQIQFQAGKIVCNGAFAKQYVAYPRSAQSVGINHTLVYQSVQGKYQDKASVFEEILKNGATIGKQLKKMEENKLEEQSLLSECDRIVKEQEEVEKDYAKNSQSKKDSKTKKDSKAAKDSAKEEYAAYQSKMAALQDSYHSCLEQYYELLDEDEALEKKNKKLKTKIANQQQEIELGLKECLTTVRRAINLTEEGRQAQKNATREVNEYSNWLEGYKNSLEEEVYNSFEEELLGMKEYTGQACDSSLPGYDFEAMKDTLQKDEGILTNLISSLQGTKLITLDQSGVQLYCGAIQKAQETLSTYSIEALELDYSTLQIPEKEENLLEDLSSVFTNSMLSLVVKDSKQLSEAKIDLSQAPSKLVQETSVGNNLGGYTNQFGNLTSWMEDSILGDLFSEITQLSESNHVVLDTTKELSDSLFFQWYLSAYFKSYTTGDVAEVETALYPSVLSYEKEYLCFHQEKDQDNLRKVVMVLVMLRLIPNLIALYGDKISNTQAETAAFGLVGFTGLAALVSVAKLLILTVWAFEEAIIDVAILLDGKELRIVPTAQHHLKFEELVMFCHTLIMSKLEAYGDNKSKEFGLSYDQYLNFFLLLQSKKNKSLHACDLIQENLRLRYGSEFLISQCGVAFEAEATVEIPNQFGPASLFTGKIVSSQEAQITYK